MSARLNLPLLAFAGTLMAAAAYFEFNLAAGAPSTHSRMNAEGIAAVAFVGATIERAARRKTFAIPAESYESDEHSTALAFFAIAASAFVAFHGVFQIPFSL